MQSRKDFIAIGALAALAPQIATAETIAATPAPKPPGKDDFPPLNFDLASFDASLQTTAAHRHLFSSTKISNGYAPEAVNSVLNAYADVSVAATDVFPAVVFYHGLSVLMAFNDAAWNELFIPAQAHMPKMFQDDFGKPKMNGGNPYLHTDKSGRDDSSLEKLVTATGARFYVCNNATRGMSGALGGYLSLKPTEVYERLKKSLVPNAMLVPAGVWAIHAIQERKFTLLQATN